MRLVSLVISCSRNISLIIWITYNLFARKSCVNYVHENWESDKLDWRQATRRRDDDDSRLYGAFSIFRVSMSIYPALFHFKQARLVPSGTRVPIVIVVGIFRLLILSRGERAFHFLRDKRRGRIPGGIPGTRVRIDRPQTRQVEFVYSQLDQSPGIRLRRYFL